jgi:hypothetical protein
MRLYVLYLPAILCTTLYLGCVTRADAYLTLANPLPECSSVAER